MRSWGSAVILVVTSTLALAGVAAAQPAPQPYPPQPYPHPYPYPYPYPYQPQPTQPPPKPRPPEPPVPMVVLMHGLCPEDTEPKCGGGLWMGLHGTTLAGADEEATFGLALDVTLGFSFGFGEELSEEVREERDSMAYVTAIAEAAIGPGIRTRMLDILPAIGLGGEAVAWGTTDRDDDPYSEGYWYGILTGHVRLDGYTLLASATRKFNHMGIQDVYQTSIEAGIAWQTPKQPITMTVWYQHFDTHVVAGLAIGVAPKILVTRRPVTPAPAATAR